MGILLPFQISKSAGFAIFDSWPQEKFGLIGYLSIDFVAFSHGAGIHQWNVPIEDVVVFAKVKTPDFWKQIQTEFL